MCQEIQLRKTTVLEGVDTIYFGGGTPSLLNKEELGLLLETIHKIGSINAQPEITLEVNPEDCTKQKLNDWLELGFNRLSIGLQSFMDDDLKWMNRSHDAKQAIKAVKDARKAGFKIISVDLIYGLPGLKQKDWLDNLTKALALSPDHISAYCLTVEAKTSLSSWVKTGQVIPLEDELQNQQFNDMVLFLAKNGFEQYEISNFAKNGNYAKHNTAYWQGKKYMGIGPSAHSFDGEKRRWNISNNIAYYKNVGLNETWYKEEVLSTQDQWNEFILTSLRTKWGINKEKTLLFGGINKNELVFITKHLKNDLLIETDEAFILSTKGKLYADGIASDLFRVNQLN